MNGAGGGAFHVAHGLLALLARVERGITFAAFLVLITVVFLDVVSRELTGSGVHWASQAGVYANVIVVMVGLGVASATGAHLRPRFADRWLPARFNALLERLQELLMALFCAAFAGLGVDIVLETWRLGEVSPVLGNPVWPVQLIVPLAFVIASLRHGLYALWPGLRPVPANGPAGP
jgi:TRAP-type C4-dicarboxylate transport system permease small subunit